MTTLFAAVPVGTRFKCNGNVCLKVSTKTALLEAYNRVFYFGMGDVVTIVNQA
jgi:hypothetical protein